MVASLVAVGARTYWSSTAPTLSSAFGLPGAAAPVVAVAWPEVLLSSPPPHAVPISRRATARPRKRTLFLNGAVLLSERGARRAPGGRRFRDRVGSDRRRDRGIAACTTSGRRPSSRWGRR